MLFSQKITQIRISVLQFFCLGNFHPCAIHKRHHVSARHALGGYLLAQPSTIKQLNEFQAWANAGPSAVSMLGARAAIEDHDFVSFCKSENIKAKEVLYKGFKKAGIPYIPSVTSFVYFDAKDYPKDIPKLMAENGILGGRSFEEKSSWLRISIGTVSEMEKVVSVL